jgi:hypothetical protein
MTRNYKPVPASCTSFAKPVRPRRVVGILLPRLRLHVLHGTWVGPVRNLCCRPPVGDAEEVDESDTKGQSADEVHAKIAPVDSVRVGLELGRVVAPSGVPADRLGGERAEGPDGGGAEGAGEHLGGGDYRELL